MSWSDVQSAAVIRYPYLWVREAAVGETEGRKLRPVAVGVRLPRAQGDALLLFPITSSRPDSGRLAVEVPATEKRRAGLDEHLRLWVVLDEYNQDAIGRSFYLIPEPPLGHFSKRFFLRFMKSFMASRSEARRVGRSE